MHVHRVILCADIKVVSGQRASSKCTYRSAISRLANLVLRQMCLTDLYTSPIEITDNAGNLQSII